MKKILVLAGLLVALSPSMASAQTLTKAEVRTLSPQLISLFTSLNMTVPSVINTKITAQNNQFKNYSILLGDMSTRLSSPAPLTSQELEGMGKVVSGIQTEVSLAAKWRADAGVAMANIVKILTNISGMIALAV